MGTTINYGVPVSKEAIQGYVQDLTGWVQYNDTEYTSANPFVVLANETLPLPNNAGVILKDQIPEGTDPLYNGEFITPNASGDAYLLRIVFDRYTSSNTGYGEITLDIGQTNPILTIPVNFPRGSGAGNTRAFVVSEIFFSGDDFLANGGKLYYESVRGNTSISNITYLISRVHKARSQG